MGNFVSALEITDVVSVSGHKVRENLYFTNLIYNLYN